jgi:macrophage erythroblast attacher
MFVKCYKLLFSEISPYKEMFEETRWLRLIDQFRQENYNLYQLSSQSVFTVALQAGLSALKTPYPFILYLTVYLCLILYII